MTEEESRELAAFLNDRITEDEQFRFPTLELVKEAFRGA